MASAMSARRAYLDTTPGEIRGVVTLDGRPEHLMLARDDDLRGQLPLSLLAGKQHPDFPYSLAILASLMIVALVYVMFVLPQMQETFDSVGIPLPAVTLFVFHSLIPYSAGFLACALVAFF
jgi:hypothetical protein